MRLATFTTSPVSAPTEQPVVRVLADDGQSYLTHEMEAAPGDGRMPQLSFTTSVERAKLFQVTDWNESERTFGLRCDLGYLTNASGEVRCGAPKKGKQETWTTVSNGAMSNQDQFLAGYLEVWSASMRHDPLAGVHETERGWRVDSGVSASDKLAVDVPNRVSELSKLSQFKFEPVDQSSTPAKELSIRSAGDRKRPLGNSAKSLMKISQLNQKRLKKSGVSVKPATSKLNKPKAAKDPNAPTKPRTAYHHYCSDQREAVKLKHPDMEGKEVTKYLGANWHGMSDEERKPYVTHAKADKARWLKEKEAYDLGMQD